MEGAKHKHQMWRVDFLGAWKRKVIRRRQGWLSHGRYLGAKCKDHIVKAWGRVNLFL